MLEEVFPMIHMRLELKLVDLKRIKLIGSFHAAMTSVSAKKQI